MKTKEAQIVGIKLPFKTQDATVAFCLYVAGVPEWMPPTNTYDEDIVFKAGGGQKDEAGNVIRHSRYRGMTLLEAAAKAAKDGKKGHVEYWFESTPELPLLLKAFEDQQALINAAGEDTDAGEAMREVMARATGRDPVTNETISPTDEREALLRITCVIRKFAKPYVDRWRTQKPRIRVDENSSKSRTVKNSDGTQVHTGAGFKSIPLDHPEHQRRRLGV